MQCATVHTNATQAQNSIADKTSFSQTYALLFLHGLHLGILWVGVRQDSSARRRNGGGFRNSTGARGGLQDRYFFLFAFLLGLDDGNVFPGVVEGGTDLGFLVLVRHALGGLEFFHQVVDLDSEGLLAGVDLSVEEHDVRLSSLLHPRQFVARVAVVGSSIGHRVLAGDHGESMVVATTREGFERGL